MSEAEIYQALEGIFAQIFKRHVELKPELSARDVPGWDSFRFVSIIMATEEHFRIELPPNDLDKLASVGDLVQAIAKQSALPRKTELGRGDVAGGDFPP